MIHAQVLLLGLLLSIDDSAALGQCTGRAAISDSVRGGFLSAAYGERADVTVEILAATGCGRALARPLSGLGATLRFTDERTDYVQIIISKDKVLDVLDLEGIDEAIVRSEESLLAPDSFAVVPPAERKPAPVPPIALPFPRVATELAADGPYFAADEAGLTAFRQRHPEGDGRGVRVAVMDQGFDLLHPAVQIGRDRGGARAPKIVDIIVRSSPERDPNWVRFGATVQALDGTFTAAGRSWTAPWPGNFRFGIFSRKIYLNGMNESRKAAYANPGLTLSVGVLWDEQSNRVWVDTDGDGSFLNQKALGDYGVTQDVDYFGRTEDGSDNRIPFGIKIDRVQRAAYLSIADGGHGALVAGPLAANRLTGGLFDGAAPGAQLIDVRVNSLGDETPVLLTSFARSDVDILNRSGHLGVPVSGHPEGDMNIFRSHVLARAIEVYDKPVACFCGAAGALFVLDYQSAQMLRRNRQLSPPYGEAMTGDSWFTPDGLVDTILAPSASLATESRYMPYALPGKDGRLQIDDDGVVLEPPAPAGYVIGANPSPTVPIVSGILADLISEARRTHVRYNGRRLTQALFTGTRRVAGFASSQQGFGLVSAAGAWSQLKKMARADDPHDPTLTSFAVTRVLAGERRSVNGFQVELSRAGRTLQDELWITRRGGYAGGRVYRFALRGDDGVYSLLDRRAILLKDQPTRVRFAARANPGFHIAFLQLIDVEAGVVMQEIPLSLRAPDVPEVVAAGIERYQQTILPLHLNKLYVQVGEDAQAARFAMRIPYGGPAFISLRAMPGFRYGAAGNRIVATTPPPGEALDAMHHVGPMQEFESLVVNAHPGTQEIAWDNRGRPEYATPYDPPAPDVPITGTLVVKKYALDFIPLKQRAVQVTNKLAAVEGKVEFYAAALTSTDLTGTGTHASASLDRELADHLSQWRVRVSSTGAADAALDAFLLNCNGKAGCEVAAQQSVAAQGTTLIVDSPTGGHWKIIVRARDRLEHPASYRVLEAALGPAANTSAAENAKFESGASWTVSLPAEISDVLYAAFRIAGSRGKDNEKDGLRVALTALTSGAP